MGKNFYIGTRLLLAFGSIIALVTLSSVLSFFDIQKINNALKNDLTESFNKLNSVLKIDSFANSYVYSQLASVKSTNDIDEKLFSGFAKEAQENLNLEEKNLLKIIGNSNNNEKILIDKMINSKNNLDKSLQELSSILLSHEAYKGESFFKINTVLAWQDFENNKQAVLDHYQKSFTDTKLNLISQNQKSIVIVGIQCLFIIIISIFLSYIITLSITKPIKESVQLSKEMAKGRFLFVDKNRKFGKCETEQLLQSIYTVNLNFRNIISSLHNSSNQIENAASEISNGSQKLSARTEQQAAYVEQTSATMKEISSTIQETSLNASNVNKLAINLSNNAQEGANLVRDVSLKVNSIKESSEKIEDIISVINNIAFQTNILALNAAVEAARAGESGRGFAVVASEVRALSQKSAQAATEIKTLILESADKIKESVDFTNEVSNKIAEISNGFKDVSSLIEQINVSTQEQSQSINQIHSAILQMDTMTQKNASLVEESATASLSLHQQSSDLKKIVNQFKFS